MVELKALQLFCRYKIGLVSEHEDALIRKEYTKQVGLRVINALLIIPFKNLRAIFAILAYTFSKLMHDHASCREWKFRANQYSIQMMMELYDMTACLIGCFKPEGAQPFIIYFSLQSRILSHMNQVEHKSFSFRGLWKPRNLAQRVSYASKAALVWPLLFYHLIRVIFTASMKSLTHALGDNKLAKSWERKMFLYSIDLGMDPLYIPAYQLAIFAPRVGGGICWFNDLVKQRLTHLALRLI